MLAVDLTTLLPAPGQHDDAVLRGCLDRAWTIPRTTLDRAGGELMAIADGRIVGVWSITAVHRDTDGGGTVRFELAAAPHWDWAVGVAPPRMRSLGRATWLHSIAPVELGQFRDRRPTEAAARDGWRLEVSPDGSSATVHGPTPHVMVTSLVDGTVTIGTDQSHRGPQDD